MKRCRWYEISLAIVLTFAGLASSVKVLANILPASSRKAAPDFTLSDSKDNPVRLSNYHGKVVLLNFWATWCHGCQMEIPWFMVYENKYKDSGLAVIGVSMDEDGWKSVKPFLEEKKLNYPVVIGNDDLAKMFGVQSMPMSLLIDRNGQIAASYAGVVDRDACESEIRALLHDEKPAAK
jgi:peroxiredoxin